MTTARKILLGACLALPLAAATQARAQSQPNGRVVYVEPGTTVAVLPGPVAAATSAPVLATTPFDSAPMLRLIAQQQAMMQRMMANMDAMFGPMPGFGAPLNIALTPMAGGHGVCSQSISIVDRGDGSAPIVHTAQSGDACGAMGVGQPQPMRQLQPAPVAPAQHGPKVLDIGYPPHPASTGQPPRT